MLAVRFGYGKWAAAGELSFAHYGAEVTETASAGLVDFVPSMSAAEGRYLLCNLGERQSRPTG